MTLASGEIGDVELCRNFATGRPLSAAEAGAFLEKVGEAEDEARRRALDADAARALMPSVAVAKGGWQLPLRSAWPLRGLWHAGTRNNKKGRTSLGGAEVDGNMAKGYEVSAAAKGYEVSAAEAALRRFLGPEVFDSSQIAGQPAAAPLGAEVAGNTREACARSLLAARTGGGGGGRGELDRAVTAALNRMAPLLIKELPRLPCASILLRVLVNPTEADMMAALAHSGHLGLIKEIELRARDLKRLEAEPATAEEGVDEEEAALRREEAVTRQAIVRTKPQYARGFYNSQSTVPSGVERAMLPLKLASMRRDMTPRDALRQLLPADDVRVLESKPDAQGGGDGDKAGTGGEAGGGGQAAGDGEDRWVQLATRLFMPGGTQRVEEDGVAMAKAAAEANRDRIDRQAGEKGVGAPQVFSQVVGGSLDLAYLSAYNRSIGFQVAVDGASNLRLEKSDKGDPFWPVALAGVLPASAYWADNSHLLTEHTWFVSNLHPESTLRCPRWQEGAHHVYDVAFQGHRVALLVQIIGMARVQVERGTQKVTEVVSRQLAWTAVPLFLDDGLPYVIDGHFQVPVYEGVVPAQLTDDIARLGCEETLRAYEASKTITLMPSASVLLRVIDVQRGMTSDGLLSAGTYPNPNPPNDPGFPAELSRRFLRCWPSLAVASKNGRRYQAPQRLAPKALEACGKLAAQGGFRLFGSGDAKVAALLLKVKRKPENKENANSSVHGSAAAGEGGGAKKPEGLTLAEFHAQLRLDTHHTTRLRSLASEHAH